MKLRELLEVVPGITSVTIHIQGRLNDRSYLFVSDIEQDLYGYEVLSVSVDYCNMNYLFIMIGEAFND